MNENDEKEETAQKNKRKTITINKRRIRLKRCTVVLFPVPAPKNIIQLYISVKYALCWSKPIKLYDTHDWAADKTALDLGGWLRVIPNQWQHSTNCVFFNILERPTFRGYWSCCCRWTSHRFNWTNQVSSGHSTRVKRLIPVSVNDYILPIPLLNST